MVDKNDGYTGGESSKEDTLHGTRCGDVINLGYKKAAYKLPKIYKYDSRIRFKHWLAGFKHFAAVTRIRESELITVLLTFLCPKSVQRVNTLCLSDVDKSDVNRTLENISKVLEKPNRISVKAKLFKARQKVGQSITEFATKLMDLATDAYPEESQDALRSKILMDVFLTGLNSEYIALSVLSDKPKTFDEAMNSAIDLEIRMAERGGRNFSDNEMSNNGALSLEDQHEGLALNRCFTCGELGHYEDGCTIKKDDGCYNINQPYTESESRLVDGNGDDEHYDQGQYNDGNYGHEYYDENYDNGKFGNENFDNENYDDGQFDDRHYDDGRFNDRHCDDGQLDDRHYDDGQFDDRHYDDSQFDDGYHVTMMKDILLTDSMLMNDIMTDIMKDTMVMIILTTEIMMRDIMTTFSMMQMTDIVVMDSMMTIMAIKISIVINMKNTWMKRITIIDIYNCTFQNYEKGFFLA